MSRLFKQLHKGDYKKKKKPKIHTNKPTGREELENGCGKNPSHRDHIAHFLKYNMLVKSLKDNKKVIC